MATFTFGDAGAGSSVLNDVAIIKDTLAYAVGAIYVNDSTGHPDPRPYNLAKWDGKNWTLQRIYFSYKILYPGSIGDSTGITAARSIFVFNDHDIWLAAGTVQHWDGTQWEQFQGDGAGFSNKIWGSNTSNMYFVGDNGTITHYSNGSWQKLESGTTLDIQDIFGNQNLNSNIPEIYGVASNLFTADGNAILQINGNQVNSFPNQGLSSYYFSSIWFNNSNLAYIAGSGIYVNRNFSNRGSWIELKPQPTKDYINSIRGNDVNDIAAVGSFGEVLHFNGKRWTSYINETGLVNGYYKGLAVKSNLVVATGANSQQAVILIGRR